MPTNRREFLRSTSAAAALGLLTVPTRSPLSALVRVATPPGSTPGDPMLHDLAMRALETAKMAGATYADVRIQDSTQRSAFVRNAQVTGVEWQLRLLLGVRVIVDGAWGFASTTRLTAGDADSTAHAAVTQAKAASRGKTDPIALAPTPAVANGEYTTPIKQDAFAVSTDEILNVIVSAQEPVYKANSKDTNLLADVRFQRDILSFASSEGSWIVQTLYTARGPLGGLGATVIPPDHSDDSYAEMDSYYEVRAGYEALTELDLVPEYQRTVENAKKLLAAKEIDVGRYDIVADGEAMGCILAQSLAPALELDRVLGYEQEEGTSYLAPPEQVLGTMHLGGPKLTVRADRSQTRGASTVGWDADGVKPEPFTVVKDGVVVDYVTNRELAPHLESWYGRQGQSVRSRGCSWSFDATSPQGIGPPNFTMDPVPNGQSIEAMIAATKKGLYVTNGVNGGTDPAVLNGVYFPRSLVYEITDGKLGALIRHAGIVARTTDLWKSIDMIGGPSTVARALAVGRKGIPWIQYPTTVSAPAARIRQVNVVNIFRKYQWEDE